MHMRTQPTQMPRPLFLLSRVYSCLTFAHLSNHAHSNDDSILEGAKLQHFKRSAFSNLPVVDCGYMPHQLAKLSWGARALFKFCRSCAMSLFFLDTLFHMLRPYDLIFCAGIVVATYFCQQYRLELNIQPTLLLNILMFPLSFAVNAAYQRREAALQHFGSFKSHTLNIYLLHRGWQFEPDLPLDFLDCSRVCIQRAFSAARMYLMSRVESEKHDQLKVFYDTVSEITLMNDVLRLSGLPPPLIAVAVGDLRDSLEAFEHLRCFSDYRTPSGIRAFMRLCQYLIPLLLTPYFATLTKDMTHPASMPMSRSGLGLGLHEGGEGFVFRVTCFGWLRSPVPVTGRFARILRPIGRGATLCASCAPPHPSLYGIPQPLADPAPGPGPRCAPTGILLQPFCRNPPPPLCAHMNGATGPFVRRGAVCLFSFSCLVTSPVHGRPKVADQICCCRRCLQSTDWYPVGMPM